MLLNLDEAYSFATAHLESVAADPEAVALVIQALGFHTEIIKDEAGESRIEIVHEWDSKANLLNILLWKLLEEINLKFQDSSLRLCPFDGSSVLIDIHDRTIVYDADTLSELVNHFLGERKDDERDSC